MFVGMALKAILWSARDVFQHRTVHTGNPAVFFGPQLIISDQALQRREMQSRLQDQTISRPMKSALIF